MNAVEILRGSEHKPFFAASLRQLSRHVECERGCLQIIKVRFVEEIDIEACALSNELGFGDDFSRIKFFTGGSVEDITGQVLIAWQLVAFKQRFELHRLANL